MEIPSYWKSTLEDIKEAMQNVTRGRVSVIGYSAGNRPIYMVEYGEASPHVQLANYSSALGAKQLEVYKKNPQPCILLYAATHGAEFEGTVSMLNLISLFETGADLRGEKDELLASWPQRAHLMLIPCMNPDGRARVGVKSVVGMTIGEFRRLAQGVWKDGTTCDWPDCKKYHPIKEYVSFMGGYFNDDGVNLMHDNFFVPMAPETQHLMRICSENAPDFVLSFHGHAGCGGGSLIPAVFEPECDTARLVELEEQLIPAFEQAGSWFVPNVRQSCQGDTRSFTQTDACHFCCGGISTLYESDQGVVNRESDYALLENRYDIILNSHKAIYKAVENCTQKWFGKEIR